MTIYRWKPGCERSGGDAQRVGEQLHSLTVEHGEKLTPTHVVAAARPDDAPLHGLFEWNDVVAADRYREEQARVVMRSIEIVSAQAAPTRMFVPIVEKVKGGQLQKTYVPACRVSAELGLTLTVLEGAMDVIETFRERYGQFQELSVVADRAQGEIYALMRKKEALSRLAPKSAPVKVTRVDQSVPRTSGTQMKELLDEYDACYRSCVGVSAPIVPGKDHKLAQALLQRYAIADLIIWVRRFFQMKDPFIRSSGYTFGVFSSCIGKVITYGQTKPPDRLDGLREFVRNG